MTDEDVHRMIEEIRLIELRSKESELSEEEVAARYKLQFYHTDEEFRSLIDEWSDWLDKHEYTKDTRILIGSSSWATGKRYVTFLFEREQDAALFRTFFGGTVAT